MPITGETGIIYNDVKRMIRVAFINFVNNAFRLTGSITKLTQESSSE